MPRLLLPSFGAIILCAGFVAAADLPPFLKTELERSPGLDRQLPKIGTLYMSDGRYFEDVSVEIAHLGSDWVKITYLRSGNINKSRPSSIGRARAVQRSAWINFGQVSSIIGVQQGEDDDAETDEGDSER